MKIVNELKINHPKLHLSLALTSTVITPPARPMQTHRLWPRAIHTAGHSIHNTCIHTAHTQLMRADCLLLY